jgi:hydroxyacylglutathione hydrolase
MNQSAANITISALPAFNDNYIWVLRRGPYVVVVDPGDAAPVLQYLHASEGELAAIMITHHHADHIGGIVGLLGYAGDNVQVFGPGNVSIPGRNLRLAGGETINVPGIETEIDVIAVPGHTASHLAYYGRSLGPGGALFCGDTLFGAGCGRLFEGTPAQMQASLSRLAVLPAPTFVYCAHEYTAANLRFACAVEPDNAELLARCDRVAALRAQNQSSVPSTLADELATNPFLRWDAPAVIGAASARLGHEPADAIETFATIRAWKDEFR